MGRPSNVLGVELPVPEPSFFAHAHPEPEGLKEASLRPSTFIAVATRQRWDPPLLVPYAGYPTLRPVSVAASSGESSA